MAKTGSVTIQMNEVLNEASEEVKRAWTNAADKTAKECVQKLRSTSPKRPGHGEYARSWGIKREKNGNGIPTVTVHNKEHYRLTHLLENGHVIRNKYGTYGRAKAIKHIQPVEEWANDEVQIAFGREFNP